MTANIQDIAHSVVEAAKRHAALNAFSAFEPELLLAAAAALNSLDEAQRSALPLAGMPLIIKDNINTVDFLTSGGTPALRANRPDADAPVVQRLREAGGLIAGKANLHELSSGGTSNNHVFGAVANPHDPACIPGGSSGGTAAAVAARIVRAGVGTDTMGSVRVPAALCGVVGFRPSTGRYSTEGVVPLTTSYDTVGPIARNVADIALLDSVLGDRPKPFELKPTQLSGVRLGIPEQSMVANAAPEVRRVFSAVKEKLLAVGVECIDVDLAEIIRLGGQASYVIMDHEFEPIMRNYLAAYAPDISLELLAEQIASPTIRKIVATRLSQERDEAAYQDAVTRLTPELKTQYQEIFNLHQLDALIFPTTPEPALPRDTDDKVFKNGESAFAWFYFMNTALASYGGNPSLTLPAGMTANGMPVGVCVDTLPGQDGKLLNLASSIEHQIKT